ncbi:MAG: TIGR03984 family CRISPR-associated protein [Candidatus Eremiobacteraeota bacterium]|nr:TIGR03984 family CRISPR-associated protein [Candidatus Eremiobacteraeota bacterium]
MLKKNDGLILWQQNSKVQERSKGEPKNFSAESLLLFINERMNNNLETFVVAYLDDKVKIGLFKDGCFKFHGDDNDITPECLKYLRVFNEESELYFWRKKGSMFEWRHRVDGVGDMTEAVDAHQAIFGTDIDNEKSSGDFSVLIEERVADIPVPLKNLSPRNDKKNICFIHTRNYIDCQNNQAGYCDCRFVGLSVF